MRSMRFVFSPQLSKLQLLRSNKLPTIHSNKNVVAYKEAFFDEASSTLCIVMEFAEGGDLQGKINEHQKNATEFSE